jgi:hypothetical protein
MRAAPRGQRLGSQNTATFSRFAFEEEQDAGRSDGKAHQRLPPNVALSVHLRPWRWPSDVDHVRVGASPW